MTDIKETLEVTASQAEWAMIATTEGYPEEVGNPDYIEESGEKTIKNPDYIPAEGSPKIVDPEWTKPEGFDPIEDVAPTIDNPDYKPAVGEPMIENPEYQPKVGEPFIDNPLSHSEWVKQHFGKVIGRRVAKAIAEGYKAQAIQAVDSEVIESAVMSKIK